MKKFENFIISLFFFTSCDNIGEGYLWNENSLDIFNRKFGTDGYDYGWSIDSSPFDNGIIIVGSQQPIIGNEKDLWAIKTNSIGFSNWDKTFGGSRDDEGRDVIATSDGGFLFVGYTWSFGNEQQVYIVKTDYHGNLEWENNYGGTMWEVGSSVIELKGGGYAIVGFTNSPGISSGNTDILLLKIDQVGNLVWLKSYGNKEFPNHEWGNDIIEVDNNFIIVGSRDRYNNGSKNILLIRIDENGEKVWDKEILSNSQTSEIAYSISKNSAGSYYVCSGVNTISDLNIYMPKILKIDGSGNIEWERVYKSNSKEYHQFRAETSDDGHTYLVGSSINELSIDDKSDAFIIKINSNGQIISSDTFGTDDEDDWGWSLDLKSDGDVTMVGSTKSYNASLFDIFLIGIKSK